MALSDYLLKGSIHRVLYKGRDGKEYMFGIYRHVLDPEATTPDLLGTDRLYIMSKEQNILSIVGINNFSNLKGGNEYTYDILNGTVFLTCRNLNQSVNSESAGVFYFYINEDGSIVSDFLSNSPAGDYLIAAKNRLFIGGTTTNYTYGGCCTFTNASAIVTPAKQATTHRQRADGVATLTLAITAMKYNWKVGDKVKITLVGGTGYNDSAATITAVSGVTISYINSGADETIQADTAGRVEPDWVNNVRAGDYINVSVPYSFTVAASTAITTLPVAGDSYTVNSSTFTVLRHNLVSDGVGTYAGTVYCTRSVGTNEPSASGTLTAVAGNTGTNITYSAVTLPNPIGVLPGFWFEIKEVNANNSLTLLSNYTYSTSLIGSYIIKRVRQDVVFHSAEDPVSDWNISGQVSGDDSGYFLSKEPVAGLHNYDDAVLIFSKNKGYFIEGVNQEDWQIPKNTKLPVGCISHKSIVSKNRWLGWLSDKGYFVSKGGALNFSDLQGEAYSELIQRTMDDVDLAVATRMLAYTYKQFLFLSVCSKEVYQSEEDPEQIFSVDRITCDTTTISIDDTDSPYTVTNTAGNIAINCDTESGDINVLMPAAADNTAIFQITKIHADNNVIITGEGTSRVIGVPEYTMSTSAGASIIIYSNGTDWEFTEAYSVMRSSYTTTHRERTGYDATITIGTHYYVAGDPIYIQGLGGSGYNGTWTVLSVEATTVTYRCNTTGDEGSTADTGGTVSPAFIGNVIEGDLLVVGEAEYPITEVIDNTSFVINELTDDLAASEYKIIKRRNNRLLVLDTRTNVRKKSYGWTVFDNVNVDSFCELDDELYYASSTTPNLFKYDTGGQLYGEAFTASFTTRKEDCGLKGVMKHFKSLEVKCKGVGRLYITPYVDDVAKDTMCIDVNNNYYESFYFPNALNPDAAVANYPKNCFGGQGETIQLYFELNGSNETLAVLPGEIGYLPLSRRMA